MHGVDLRDIQPAFLSFVVLLFSSAFVSPWAEKFWGEQRWAWRTALWLITVKQLRYFVLLVSS